MIAALVLRKLVKHYQALLYWSCKLCVESVDQGAIRIL